MKEQNLQGMYILHMIMWHAFFFILNNFSDKTFDFYY